MVRVILLLLLPCSTFANEVEARARANLNYVLSMGEGAEQPNVIAFKNLDALTKAPAGEWRTVQVCNQDGTGCHFEQRWFPSQELGLTRSTVAGGQSKDSQAPDSGINDALDELNAQRAQRGLYPYIRDELLTRGAQNVANARAAALLFEHTANDFAYLPAGAQSNSAGCAAYANSEFLACGIYDNGPRYAGAAYAVGRDGKRYMHAFYR